MASFRKPKNSKDLLVRAKVRPLEEKIRECFAVERTDARFINLLKQARRLLLMWSNGLSTTIMDLIMISVGSISYDI